MVRFLVVAAVLGGCITVVPTSVIDADDIVVRSSRRASTQPRGESQTIAEFAAEHKTAIVDAEDVEVFEDNEADSSEEPEESADPDAPSRSWQDVVTELERNDSDGDRFSYDSELAQVLKMMPAEARDFLEAVCRSSRWLDDEWLLMRAVSEVRRRAGTDVRKLYGSLRSMQSAGCAQTDVARLRLDLAEIGAANDSALRAHVQSRQRMFRLGVGTRQDTLERSNEGELQLSGLRTEVAAALPGSLELANLDELIRVHCAAFSESEDGCPEPSLDDLAHLVKVRAKALGAKHPDVASARRRYAALLLVSADAKQRTLGEKQLRKAIAAGAPGSMSRVLATAELVVALRVRQDREGALVLERAFVKEAARPTSDRDVTLLAEAAATMANIAMSDHRDDDAYAILQALMKAFAVTPLDVCGDQHCDVREAQIEALKRQASIQPVRAYEIEERITEIVASIEASERAQ